MTRNYLAEHYGAKCLDRLMWIRTADWRNELNCDLFESWQAVAVRYAVAAGHAAREAMPLLHLTLTGPDAGTPFCGVNKAQARERGDTFAHVPYSNLDVFFARPEMCPACKAAWDAAGALVCRECGEPMFLTDAEVS